jgi:hypothetical protein
MSHYFSIQGGTGYIRIVQIISSRLHRDESEQHKKKHTRSLSIFIIPDGQTGMGGHPFQSFSF